MPFSKMDPSCTIGFYSRSVQDYEKISQELSKVGNGTTIQNATISLLISQLLCDHNCIFMVFCVLAVWYKLTSRWHHLAMNLTQFLLLRPVCRLGRCKPESSLLKRSETVFLCIKMNVISLAAIWQKTQPEEAHCLVKRLNSNFYQMYSIV